MKKTSLADIAKALGVSKTLVSMVLNNKGDENGINSDTQKRVLAKAAELNYQPNQIARGLRTGSSNTIGLVVADISNVFYAKIARAVEDIASQSGFRLIICSSDENPKKESDLIRMMRERQVDGIIISPTQDNNEAFKEMVDSNYPLVLIDRALPKIDTNYVIVDNFQGGYDAVSHLIKAGLKKIGLLTISPSHLTNIRERAEGYRAALRDADIKFDENLVREIPYDDVKNSIQKEVKSLISAPHSIQGLFVVNNNLATSTMEYINKVDLRIPQDLALVGFDDIELFKFCYPPVTAIAQPIEELGKKAVEILIKKIKDKSDDTAKVHVVLSSRLVIRRSCGTYMKQI